MVHEARVVALGPGVNDAVLGVAAEGGEDGGRECVTAAAVHFQLTLKHVSNITPLQPWPLCPVMEPVLDQESKFADLCTMLIPIGSFSNSNKFQTLFQNFQRLYKIS